MNNDIMIASRNITHYYGKKLIYRDLNFEVSKGKILGLLGKNGTGKTTIINILNGYLKPVSGDCYLLGKKIETLMPEDKAKIGLLLEGHVQYSFFNVAQLEKFYAPFFKGHWNRDAYYGLIEKLHIVPTQKLSTMSCGQRSQVVLGLLMAQDPELLILDDFSMGLDPGYRRLFVEYIKEWATAGNKTIFLTSHIIQDMERLIDDCMILDYGHILIHRPTKEILEGFKRYTFYPENELPKLEHDHLYSIEQKRDGRVELYSFLNKNELSDYLVSNGFSLGTKPLNEEKISLEDAFIGLTGKY